MARRSTIFARLSYRQRRAVATLGLVLLVSAGGVGYVWLGTRINQLEELLAEGQEAIETIRTSAKEYLDSMHRKHALEEAIKQNDPKIQTAIDSLARKVPVTRPDRAGMDDATFDKVLRYEAKTTERPVYLGKTGKKRKRNKTSEFIELSQPMEYSFVKFSDLVKFLEEIESPERLMYVSKLAMTRKYLDPEFVQGKLTVATFIYKPEVKTGEEGEE